MRFTLSASRHGFTIVDAVYAIENAVGYVASFTEPHPPATLRPHLYIGPVSLHDHRLIEVFVEIDTPNLTIFHVMYASEDNLNRIGRSYR